MTNPAEPQRSFNPQQYSQPQVPPQQPAQQPPQQGPGWPPTGPQQRYAPQQQPPVEQPVPPRKKGFFGALLDTKFDAMVTPMLIRGFYLLALAIITMFSLAVFLLIWGLAGDDTYGDAPAWPFIVAVIFTPVFWLFQVLIVRMALEFVINQFKITEELQKIRRNTTS
jgi:hypothetical protein